MSGARITQDGEMDENDAAILQSILQQQMMERRSPEFGDLPAHTGATPPLPVQPYNPMLRPAMPWEYES